MPHIIKQPDDTDGVPRLLDPTESRKALRCGHNKWNKIQHEIEYVEIGGKKFRTPEALAAWLRRKTRRAPNPEAPRRAAPRKTVPPPPKGRRKQSTPERREAP